MTSPEPASSRTGPELRKTVLRVKGMDCADCAVLLEKYLSKVPGVAEVSVSFGAATMQVSHTEAVSPDSLRQKVAEAGYRAELENLHEIDRPESLWRSRRAQIAAASGLLAGAGFLLSAIPSLERWSIPAYALAMAAAGLPVLRVSLLSLRSGTLDMNVLMGLAAVGAAIIGEWSEGATVLFLFAMGETLEAMTLDKTRRSIRSLMALTPNEASCLRSGMEERLPVEEIRIGDILLVRPGERIAMDGVVLRGQSAVNQAPITGESVPVDKREGDEVFAGTINSDGVLEVRITRSYRENTLSRIIYLVEEAQAQKAPSQRFVDRFARIYTPSVIGLAALISIIPPLLMDAPFKVWFYKALMLMVISCPCALVISTPVAIAAAIGAASRSGVLIKGGAYLEAFGGLKVMAFDKTGTLTEGKPAVVDIVSLNGLPPREVLRLAASLESRSEHPLARAIVARAEKENLPLAVPADIRILPGQGLQAALENRDYWIGSPTWLGPELGFREGGEAAARLQEEGKTAVVLTEGRAPVGIIALADAPRPGAAEAVRALKREGIRRVAMLTGDHLLTARQIARQTEVDEVKAGLLPEGKVAAVRELIGQHGAVAMVGDGINDAPALAAATVGIAMGAAGTDTALETADIALMGDDLSRLPYIAHLSRRTLGILRQNVAFALILKLSFLALAFLGAANLWMAVFADTGASLIVIMNSMRLLRESR
ncbi:MAG: cadmium-translocating P-type ATPase [Armatimonadetes bacterium]|nr:cadmium-translocating P-type ATPase [Armatimonadota bacterium]